MSDEPSSYILRISRDELQRKLYTKYSFYVGIKRNWSRGARVLFVKKDAFIGSGIIDRFVARDTMEEEWEKKMCDENNWYGKIEFSKLIRFQPPVPVHNTSVVGQNPITLHGASIPINYAKEIERLAIAKIIL